MIQKLLKSLHDWLFEKIPKPFHRFCTTYPKLGWVLLVATIVIVSVSPLFVDFDYKYNNPEGGVATVVAGITDEASTPVGGSEYFVFTDLWKAEDDKSYTLIGDAVALSSGFEGAVFNYAQRVPKLQNFSFALASEGLSAVNLNFGRHDFYEVVIGDGDNETVSLKVKQKINGHWIDIEEFAWKNFRPEANASRPRMTECEIESGEQIEVDIGEKFVENTNKFELSIMIHCDNASVTDSFNFFFDPTPNWEKRDRVYFGLMDLSDDSANKTKIYFIEPDILEALQNI